MKPLTVRFYMRGGHVVTATRVKSVEMTRDNSTGSYSGYTLEWNDPKDRPSMFTVSIPDIVAVVATEGRSWTLPF